MVINTNIAAMAASRTLAKSTNSLSSSLARLSSGSKIVSPEDAAAGLAQSIRFDAQINRNHAVQSNLTNAGRFSNQGSICIGSYKRTFRIVAGYDQDRYRSFQLLCGVCPVTKLFERHWHKEF